MRLFTAIELPDAVRAHLVRVRDVLKTRCELSDAVSWVKPENLHVTLKFLGEVPDDRVAPLVQSLQEIRVESMELFAKDIVCFPRRNVARVFAAGLGGEVDGLARLFAGVELACASEGFAREARAYTPHITFGRARTGRRLRVPEEAAGDSFPGPSFRAGRFVLMHSALRPTGAIYEPIAHFPLP